MTDFSLDTTPIAVPFQNAVRRLQQTRFAEGLWASRLDMWRGDAATREKIGNRLGWLRAIDVVSPQLPRLRALSDAIRQERFSDVVLLGMGGSSLAPEVLRSVAGVAPASPRFRVLDSVDPDAVRDAMANAATTLFILASKSGSTIEVNVLAAEAQRRIVAAGIPQWGPRFVAITDEHTVLHRRAEAERFRDVFVNPSDIGGRYSALSFFGMVPAAVMGIDLDALLEGATRMAEACRREDPLTNPGLALGAFMASAALAGRDKLTLLAPEALAPFGLWVEQLVAESTGKQARGVVPIAGERPGAPIGPDRSAVAIQMGGDAPPQVDRFAEAGVPLLRVTMAGATSLGAEFFRWEVATAAAGLLLDINPFDEPNVQQAKDATRALLQTYSTAGRLPTPEPHGLVEGVQLTLSRKAEAEMNGAGAAAFLRTVLPGDYVGLLAYLPPEAAAWTEVLANARAAIAARTSCATMFGYGPRYLHSTGQLHKGGPNTGVFIIVTADAREDLPIPREPFSFFVLEMAQAVGDFQSLDGAGRRALHVHLPRRDPTLIERIVDVLVTSE